MNINIFLKYAFQFYFRYVLFPVNLSWEFNVKFDAISQPKSFEELDFPFVWNRFLKTTTTLLYVLQTLKWLKY